MTIAAGVQPAAGNESGRSRPGTQPHRTGTAAGSGHWFAFRAAGAQAGYPRGRGEPDRGERLDWSCQGRVFPAGRLKSNVKLAEA